MDDEDAIEDGPAEFDSTADALATNADTGWPEREDGVSIAPVRVYF